MWKVVPCSDKCIEGNPPACAHEWSADECDWWNDSPSRRTYSADGDLWWRSHGKWTGLDMRKLLGSGISNHGSMSRAGWVDP
jgi:hypothetical protein